MGSHTPEAVDEQRGSVEGQGIGDGEGVGSVEAVCAPVEIAPVDVNQACRLGLGLGDRRRKSLERVERDALLAELTYEPACRLGEAGCVRDGPEVSVGRTGNLARVPARGHRRQRSPPGIDERPFAESDPQLTERGEADVEQTGRGVGDQTLQVWALKDAADEDVDRRERILRSGPATSARSASSSAAGDPSTSRSPGAGGSGTSICHRPHAPTLRLSALERRLCCLSLCLSTWVRQTMRYRPPSRQGDLGSPRQHCGRHRRDRHDGACGAPEREGHSGDDEADENAARPTAGAATPDNDHRLLVLLCHVASLLHSCDRRHSPDSARRSPQRPRGATDISASMASVRVLAKPRAGVRQRARKGDCPV